MQAHIGLSENSDCVTYPLKRHRNLAALDAVTQWEFSPTVLNGKPIPVLLTITVRFTLP